MAGTTLVELLICVIFLGLCAAAMLNAVGAASRQASVAEEKLLALATAKNQIAQQQAAARDGTLAVGTSTTNPTDTGIRFPVTVTTTVSAVGGYTDLYQVLTRVSWVSDIGAEHSGAVQLQTYVVTNDK